MIAHNKPLITAEDQAAVQAVLQSGWVAEGPAVEALERHFEDMNGGGDAVAVSSGTAALFLALHGLGLESGAKVAVPTYACSALLNAVTMVGAVPVPVDVRADDFNIDPQALRDCGEDFSAVIAVHTFGASSDIAALQTIVPRVIEDCCQSLGGPQGRQGAAAVYSFYATKVITGGQGGLVWEGRGDVAARVRDYREFDCRETYTPRFNLQMTDIQAAMISSQFARLDEIRARRRDIRARYVEAAAGLMAGGWRLQGGFDDDDILPYRFVLVAPEQDARDVLRATFADANVATIVPMEGYELLHNYLNLSADRFPVAEVLARTALSIPLYPGLDDDDVTRICETLENAL